MEKHDIYDMYRSKTGKTTERGKPLDAGEYRLAVTACIFNAKGELLVQQRQPFKDDWANMWDFTAAGSAISGETPQTAIERELFEELGLTVNLQGIRPHLTVNFKGGFNDFFLLEREVDLSELCLQYEEVQAVRWAGREEVLAMIEKGEFISYYPGLVDFIFESRKAYGSHKSEHLKKG